MSGPGSRSRSHDRAHMRDEIAGVEFRQSRNPQRIDAARAFDADIVPDQPAVMLDLGHVRHWQMFFLARPGHEPEAHFARGNPVTVGGHPHRKNEVRDLKRQQRPDPAGANFVMLVAGSDRTHECALPNSWSDANSCSSASISRAFWRNRSDCSFSSGGGTRRRALSFF